MLIPSCVNRSGPTARPGLPSNVTLAPNLSLWIHRASRALTTNHPSVMWAAAEHSVREAEDVHEVIAWAEEEARLRSAIYTLYAVVAIGEEEGLVWLAGVDPTRGLGGPNFDRRHPADV